LPTCCSCFVKGRGNFRAAGYAAGKLARHQRGVDIERFTPRRKRRKSSAQFLSAPSFNARASITCWSGIAWICATRALVLVGTPHDEILPWLDDSAATGPRRRFRRSG
jgi:hypothetical protein